MSTSTQTPAPGTRLDGAALRSPIDWKYPIVYGVLALLTLVFLVAVVYLLAKAEEKGLFHAAG